MGQGDQWFPDGEGVMPLPEVDVTPHPPVVVPERLEILPGVLPPGRIPEQPAPWPDDDALRLVLERARLIAEELATALQPSAQALRDGAWVSRRADEFSLELDDSARHLATIGDRAVEAIEELARRGGPDEGEFDTLPHYLPGGPNHVHLLDSDR